MDVGSERERDVIRKRLQQSAARLDTDWLAVVSRLAVENCHEKRSRAQFGQPLFQFDFLCERRWEQLQPTTDQAVRFCDGCQQPVYYCDTIMEARDHAYHQRCVAVDLGVIRGTLDLTPMIASVGRPSPETIQQEQAHLIPDRVSFERSLRKLRDSLTKPEADSGATDSNP
jgi:hypothetical protein